MQRKTLSPPTPQPTPLPLAPLKPEQFAALSQWHPESVRRAIRAGRIAAVKFGRGWRIPQAEAQRILTTGLPVAS